MVYTILFLIGVIGMAAMLLLGLGHGGGGGHAGHLGHTGGGHAGHIGHGGHGAQGHTHGSGHHHDSGSQATRNGSALFFQLLSPLTLISLALGAGATGLILGHFHWPSTMIAAAAAVGALGFYGLVIRPMFSLALSFASNPSKALEGTTAKTAEAASKFDASGRGVVTVNVDGQLVRVLAELEPDDRIDSATIRPGDQLTVVSVDGHRNTCRVSRM